MKSYFLLSTLVLTLFSLSSFAQNSNTSGKQEKFKKLDANQDGRIDKQEFDAMGSQKVSNMNHRRAQAFDRMDLNKDQQLDPKEMEAARNKRMANAAQHRAKQGQRASGPIAAQMKKAKRTKALLGRMDTNKDKQIDFNEFQAMKNKRPNANKINPREAFDRIDADKNGLLSPQELRMAHAKRIKQKGRNQPIRR